MPIEANFNRATNSSASVGTGWKDWDSRGNRPSQLVTSFRSKPSQPHLLGAQSDICVSVGRCRPSRLCSHLRREKRSRVVHTLLSIRGETFRGSPLHDE